MSCADNTLRTMASKCKCCCNSISNSEFVTCSGQCNELFHIKCVSVNKMMLNAINACPNIHWYCHDCNAGNRNIAASIDNINAAIGGLTKSLSENLPQFVDGFKSQMERFVDTFNSTTISMIGNLMSASSNCSADDRRVCSDEGQVTASTCKSKLESSHCDDDGPLKSVVLSNIGKDVTADYLVDYLSDKLKIGRDKLRVSMLLPSSRSFEEVTFLQFKVTMPQVYYSSIVCAKLWPRNVHIRDFIFKSRKIETVTVSKRQFLNL